MEVLNSFHKSIRFPCLIAKPNVTGFPEGQQGWGQSYHVRLQGMQVSLHPSLSHNSLIYSSRVFVSRASFQLSFPQVAGKLSWITSLISTSWKLDKLHMSCITYVIMMRAVKPLMNMHGCRKLVYCSSKNEMWFFWVGGGGINFRWHEQKTNFLTIDHILNCV